MDKSYQSGIRCIFSFLNPILKRRKSIKFRITPKCFDKLFVFVNDDITKQIMNMRDASTPKLNLATNIFHVDLFVVLFSAIFLLCGDLKFNLMFSIKLI